METYYIASMALKKFEIDKQGITHSHKIAYYTGTVSKNTVEKLQITAETTPGLKPFNDR